MNKKLSLDLLVSFFELINISYFLLLALEAPITGIMIAYIGFESNIKKAGEDIENMPPSHLAPRTSPPASLEGAFRAKPT